MRKTILTIRDGECRYPLTNDLPHMFCGEPVLDSGTAYCGPHHCTCYTGFGKNPRALEDMIYGIESTIVRRRTTRESTNNTEAVDTAITSPHHQGCK